MEDLAGLLVLVGLVAAIVVAIKRGRRPHTLLLIKEGQVEVARGKPPRALVSDLRDVAKRALEHEGAVAIRGWGERLSFEVTGLPEAESQRVRNVVHMHRKSM
jgi:hypothetical protein